MKKIGKKGLAFLMVLCFSLGTSASVAYAGPIVGVNSENLLVNGNFNNGLTEWDYGESVVFDTTPPLRFESPITDSAGTLSQSNIALTKGTYDIMFYYHCDVPGVTPEVELRFSEETDSGYIYHTGETSFLYESSPMIYRVIKEIEITKDGNYKFEFISKSRCLFKLYFICLRPTKPFLVNGGFEEGMDYWEETEPGEGGIVRPTQLAARTGENALLMAGKETVSAIQYGLIKEPGYYELSAYFKSAFPFTGSGVGLDIACQDDTHDEIVYEFVVSGNDITNDWNRISLRVYIPENAVTIQVGIGVFETTGIFLVDDIQLEKIEPDVL